MAGFRALRAVGLSIEALLEARLEVTYRGPNPPEAALAGVKAKLVTADAFDRQKSAGSTIPRPGLSIYFYRLSLDRESRPPWSAVTAGDGIRRLPLRLHFLVTAWVNDAEFEMELLGLAAQTLERQSILTGPLLHQRGSWRSGESVQIVLDDLALESMSETFQALTTDYRLCLPYLARVVLIEDDAPPPAEPVATLGRAVTTPAAALKAGFPL
jgi:hypothetical protein